MAIAWANRDVKEMANKISPSIHTDSSYLKHTNLGYHGLVTVIKTVPQHHSSDFRYIIIYFTKYVNCK